MRSEWRVPLRREGGRHPLGSRIPSVGSLTIEPVGKTEQARAIATLVSAFIADPVERWLFPEPVAYLRHFAAFVAAFGGEAFETQTVWRLKGFAAVAMWIPPGAKPDDARSSLF